LRKHSTCHYYAFRKACIDEGFRSEAGTDYNDMTAIIEAEVRNQQDDSLKLFAHSFLINPGLPIWEKTFGRYWDEAWNAKRKESNQNEC
jgi:hypothetical protein